MRFFLFFDGRNRFKMSTKEVAESLVRFCRQGQFKDAINELYHNDIVSVEVRAGVRIESKGIEAIKEKAQQFDADCEKIIVFTCSDPVVSDHHFSVAMNMQAEFKSAPETVHMSEIALYEVKDGKIIKEEFHYH